jgi:molybdenum cofactor cytidylyltransferase
MSLHGDAGARALLLEAGANLAAIEVDDPGVLLDVDTPVDLRLLNDRPGGQTLPGNG